MDAPRGFLIFDLLFSVIFSFSLINFQPACGGPEKMLKKVNKK